MESSCVNSHGTDATVVLSEHVEKMMERPNVQCVVTADAFKEKKSHFAALSKSLTLLVLKV